MTMTSPTDSQLSNRITQLTQDLEQIQPLLSNLRISATGIKPSIDHLHFQGQSDQIRLELSAEIHTRLKEIEDQMELVRVDVDSLEVESTEAEGRRKGWSEWTGMGTSGDGNGSGSESATEEKERVISLAGRLEEDLRRFVFACLLSLSFFFFFFLLTSSIDVDADADANDIDRTRGNFRSAQLEAKRTSEMLKRDERRSLYSPYAREIRINNTKNNNSNTPKTNPQPTQKRKEGGGGIEKLTQETLIQNTSNDITKALKRTYNIMQTELSKSQFAQETLEQSTAALSSLSDSYGNVGNLLSSTRGLVGSLLRSQKSDTWYLESSFYIIIITIAWLVFHRFLYGPFLLLVWFPGKLFFKFFMVVLGVFGVSSSSSASAASSSSSLSSSTAFVSGQFQSQSQSLVQSSVPIVSMTTSPTGINVGIKNEGDKESESLLNEIDNMAGGQSKGTEESGTEKIQGNPKKRMYEEDVEVKNRRDEL